MYTHPRVILLQQATRGFDRGLLSGIARYARLSDRFYTDCGCSIIKQLPRARVDHIARLLTDTELRIHKIASSVGFEDDRHFSRYFKRATGLTPQAYRSKHSPP